MTPLYTANSTGPTRGDSQIPGNALAWHRLQQALQDALATAVPAGSRVIYVDYPVSKNVGDLLIYLGTLRWLERVGLQVEGIFSGNNFRNHRIGEDVIILTQGGGNFGDIYPKHQLLREALCQNYPHNRIVSLPQTIYFNQENNLRASAKILNAHGSFYIFCRCVQSLSVAAAEFDQCNPVLAPDMATFLYPLRRLFSLDGITPSLGRYYLMRDDVERSVVQAELDGRSDIARGDWVDLIGTPNRAIGKAVHWTDQTAFAARYPSMLERLWRRASTRMAATSARELVIWMVTSRVAYDGYVCWLGTTTSDFDSSYGNSSSYVSMVLNLLFL